MIKYKNPIISSLTQSICDCVDMLLKEYQSLNPLFKYKLSYGSNYDTNTDDDTFSIAIQIGNIQRIPTHYENINGEETLLFGGTTDVSLSIINPISVQYLNNIPFSVVNNTQIDPNLLNQTTENYGQISNTEELDKISTNKIEDNIRLLEGLSLFMYKKNMIVNNFNLTLLTDLPLITGEFDYGVYRLSENLMITCKFLQQNEYELISGENTKVKFNLKENNVDNWLEFHSIIDFSKSFGAVDNTFPTSNLSITQNLINQSSITFQITAPSIRNLDANKKLAEIEESGELNKLQNIPMKYSEDGGTTWKSTIVNISSFTNLVNMNAFGSDVYLLTVTSPIIGSDN